MSRKFDDILNECLERIAAGEDIQQCADRYPQHREELVPLLGVAAGTMGVAATPPNVAQAKARGLTRLTQALAEHGAPEKPRVPFFWRPVARPIVIGLAAVLLTAMAAGGTTVAATNSLPGNPLYWVKTTKENITLRLPRSDIQTAKMHAGLAQERGKEMRRLIAKGRIDEAELVAGRMRGHLSKSAVHAGVVVPANTVEMPLRTDQPHMTRNALELRARLERDGRVLRAELLELLSKVPPRHRERVRQVLRESELRYRILIEALYVGESPQRSPLQRVEPPRSNDQ